MATFNKVNAFVGQLGLATLNLNTDAIKFMLTNTAPVVTNDAYSGGSSNISGNEVANGNGYTTGGVTATTSYSQSGGVGTLAASFGGGATWTASGAGFGPFRYIVSYDSTPTIKSIIGWWDYGSTISSLTVGQTFTLSAASGILTLQ